MPKITIVTVNWFSSASILTMLINLQRKAKHTEKLGALIIDNTNGQDLSLKEIIAWPIKTTILPLNALGLKGSKGHALALDYATSKLCTEFSLIVDPDIYVFREHWDRLCIKEMKALGAIAIGAPYPPWKVGKYHDFPSPPFCFFHTKQIQQAKNGWAPYGKTMSRNTWTFCLRQIGRLGSLLTRKRYEKYPFLRKYAAFSENLLGVFSQDTGWRLAEEMRNKGLKTITFTSIMPEDKHLTPKNCDVEFESLTREYETFAYHNQVFLTHKYGSGAPPWRTEHGNNLDFWQHCTRALEKEMA